MHQGPSALSMNYGAMQREDDQELQPWGAIVADFATCLPLHLSWHLCTASHHGGAQLGETRAGCIDATGCAALWR